MGPDTEFLFLGGRLCLDFVNTEIAVHGQRRDLLPDFARWMAWQAVAGVPGKTEANTFALERQEEGLDEEEFRQAIVFRSGMRRMARCIVSRKPIPESALRGINDLLRRGSSYGQLTRAGSGFSLQVRRDVRRPADLLVPVADDAADLLCEGDLSRVRKCGNPACVLFFYDTSRSRTRRWCSMRSCGNRAKAAAHYRRRQDGGTK
jgi:predicted RNA-binding Zn ribbon-like protein